jgi:methylenetetrahydrofolate--tRNA-(uracil-5-)-methyltransferase
MAGVEGYVESAALGLLAGINASFAARGDAAPIPPRETAHGALIAHLMDSSPKHFQPTNVNFGLFPPLSPGDVPAPREPGKRAKKDKKRDKQEALARRALTAIEGYAKRVSVRVP